MEHTQKIKLYGGLVIFLAHERSKAQRAALERNLHVGGLLINILKRRAAAKEFQS